MTTTSPAGLAVGRWTVDPAHSTATFRVRSLGRTVIGNVPITEGIVDVDESGRPAGGSPVSSPYAAPASGSPATRQCPRMTGRQP